MKKMKNNQPLVSIITPSFNCEGTIKDTIESVINQSYQNIEMIIVDDLSTDNSVDIINDYCKKDNRIKLFKLKTKGGASAARNKGIENAKGKYVAFLDADDLWKQDKLEKQIKFMEDNNYYFTYTDYEYIDFDGNKIGEYRKCPSKMSYRRMLIGDSVGCLTVIYNQEKTGKIKLPLLKKRNDYALWCMILKIVKVGYKYDDILALYRKNHGSLSSGPKYGLLKYHYKLHRKVNKCNVPLSFIYTGLNVFNFFVNKGIRDRKFSKVSNEEGVNV